MMKLIISFIMLLGLYASETNIYNKNMDRKVYYDADRTKNEVLQEMSEVLERFITSEVNASLIKNYKDGKLKLSEEELELKDENTQEEIVDNGEDSKIEDKEEVGFFAKMLEKVGIGSTKKLPVESEESVTKQELGNEEKLPEVTNKEVAKEEVVEEEPKEEVTDVTNEDTTTKEINTEVTDDTIQ